MSVSHYIFTVQFLTSSLYCLKYLCIDLCQFVSTALHILESILKSAVRLKGIDHAAAQTNQ